MHRKVNFFFGVTEEEQIGPKSAYILIVFCIVLINSVYHTQLSWYVKDNKNYTMGSCNFISESWLFKLTVMPATKESKQKGHPNWQ